MQQNRNVEDIFAATPLQQGMLYHALSEQDPSAYLEQYTFVVDRALDGPAYQKAWQKLTDRQPMLRSSFHWEGLQKAYLVTHKTASSPVTLDDIAHLSAHDQNTAVEEWLRRDRDRGFRLDKAPLFRVHVHRLAEERHRITLTLHHAIADGWSLTILLNELNVIYEATLAGGNADLGAAPSVRAYLEWLGKRDHQGARGFWRERLSTVGAATPIPLATEGGSGSTKGQSRSRSLVFDESDSQAFRAASRKIGVTESTVFSAAWALVLSRYGALDQVMFGETVSTRPAEIPDVERTIGLFLNVLPNVVEIDEEATCRDWLRGVQSTKAAARRQDFFPLVEMQPLSGLPPGTPLFSTMVVWENQPGGGEGSETGSNCTEPVRSYEKNNYALMLGGYPEKRIRLALTYDPVRFDENAIDCLLHQVRGFMLQLVAAPDGTVSTLRLDATRSATESVARGGPALTLAHGDPWSCFDTLVSQAGEAPALVDEHGDEISRGELSKRAIAIATRVEAALPGRGQLGIWLHPGVDYAASILAALRLNRPWLALDPRRPQAAILETLAEHGPCVIVTSGDLWTMDEIDLSGANPVVDCATIGPAGPGPTLPTFTPPAPEDIACVVFTSGSTGRPKGVQLPHMALANRLAWMARDVPTGPRGLGCLKTSPAFVDAVCEILSPLVLGYPAVVPDPDTAHDPVELWRVVAERNVTHLVLTPTVLSALIAQNDGTLPGVRVLQVSGEAFSPVLATRAQDRFPNARILNFYGSSEVMGDATWYELRGGESEITIGRPIAGIDAWILDAEARPLPDGAVGELMISGAGLATGYLGDPDGSAKVFRMWTGPDGKARRLYRTGDMALRRADGALMFRGRRDSQLKIRGIRIEPGEIEVHLKAHDAVDQAVVAPFAATSDDPRLVAYVTRQQGTYIETQELASQLRTLLVRRLPRSMVPDAIVVLDAMPKTATGKVDRRNLPAPSFAARTENGVIEPPATETERQMLELWTTTLGRPVDSTNVDFFEAGGNSILMTQLCFNIRRQFEVAFPIRAALEHPDARGQAMLVDALKTGTTAPLNSDGPVDLEKESRLAEDIAIPTGQVAKWPSSGARIFLSGAEGFINAWLLARLLDEPGALVSCLASAKDDAEALDRIASHLRSFALWTEARGRKLRAVAGDLGSPQLGLSSRRWAELAHDTDVLFHTGVRINFVSPYDRLRPSNVQSTRTMIELAVSGTTKPLHFVGSLGVIDHSTARADSPAADEASPIDCWQGLPNGYLQVRWVSDRMMRRALERGLPGSVMRMTTVCGDLVNHRPNPQDMFWRLVELMIQSGAVPDGERPVNFVPVDQAADAMITLAKGQTAGGAIHHLCNAADLKWRDIGRVLRDLGYSIDCLSGPDWVARVASTVDRASPLWQETLPLIGDAWRDYEHFIPIRSEKTRARLAANNVKFHPVDDELLARNIRALIDLERLSSPSKRVATTKTNEFL
ncbi:thioester reductase domain-containing protein [Ensifer sp. ENS06]|uniref:non-ribosomal peptide synthetase family protein n=1 Tax=Ensifer sp. ENS06 TaxID=2769276 RepID=UPI0017856DD6|nr:non-ribosomal peptide synthetase [Ensifer sp. ENS06]MBD9628168.1 thioester reductase domain-containing protein [Ensifer sp. ENS06]